MLMQGYPKKGYPLFYGDVAECPVQSLPAGRQGGELYLSNEVDKTNGFRINLHHNILMQTHFIN